MNHEVDELTREELVIRLVARVGSHDRPKYRARRIREIEASSTPDLRKMLEKAQYFDGLRERSTPANLPGLVERFGSR